MSRRLRCLLLHLNRTRYSNGLCAACWFALHSSLTRHPAGKAL